MIGSVLSAASACNVFFMHTLAYCPILLRCLHFEFFARPFVDLPWLFPYLKQPLDLNWKRRGSLVGNFWPDSEWTRVCGALREAGLIGLSSP